MRRVLLMNKKTFAVSYSTNGSKCLSATGAIAARNFNTNRANDRVCSFFSRNNNSNDNSNSRSDYLGNCDGDDGGAHHLTNVDIINRRRRRRRRVRRIEYRCYSTNNSTNNSSTNNKQKVLVITGPTAIGKSKLAIEIALKLGAAEIVSSDSIQVYKDLDVGANKVTLSERQSIAHHMIDICDPTDKNDAFDVYEFYVRAISEIENINGRGNVAIVCGGTGMYLQWLVNGRTSVPKSTVESSMMAKKVVDDIRLKYSSSSNGDVSDDSDNSDNIDDDNNNNTNNAAAMAWDEAIQMLRSKGDLETSEKLARNDWYRLTRALEILESSGGRPKSSFKPTKDETKDFRCFALSMNRVELYRRMDERVEEMVSSGGLLKETEYLLQQGVLPGSNSASRAIGYAQAMKYLLKQKEVVLRRENSSSSSSASSLTKEDLLEFIDELQRETRMYAKRQFTWIRSEPNFEWIDASAGIDKAAEIILKKFNDDDDVGASVKTTIKSNNSQISEVTKEVANELKRYRVELKHFNKEEVINSALDQVRDIISRL